MNQKDFERIAAREFAGLPPSIRERLDNVQVVVRRRPGKKELEEAEPGEGDLLGLYVGTPLDARAGGPGIMLPDRIYLFQEAIEAEAGGDPEETARVVRETLLHEIAHHFGFSEEDVEAWEREQEE